MLLDPKESFYYGTVKQIVGGFGALFSNIHIERRIHDTVQGEVAQKIKVPTSYGPKEKWMTQLNADPVKQKQVNIVLPRISYEIIGFTYDSSRKSTRSSTIKCATDNGDGTASSSIILSPAPWNVELALYIVGNKTEDVLQILEQILPFFNPDYSITIKSVPQMNITSTVPITLSGVNIQDDYSGDMVSQRIIVYTLSFNAKANMYGPIATRRAVSDIIMETGGDGYYDVFAEFDTNEEGNLEYTGVVTTTYSKGISDRYSIINPEDSDYVENSGYEVHEVIKEQDIDGNLVNDSTVHELHEIGNKEVIQHLR